jgi:hypothetical protein
MAPRAPAGPSRQKGRMVELADDGEPWSPRLSMAFQTQIVILFDQELAGNGAMRAVADGAALAKGFVLKNPGPGLLAVALHAHVISPGCKDSFWFVDILTVRIMTVGAGHAFFRDRMTVLEGELRFRVQVALEAGPGMLVGIHNVYAPPSSGFHVKAARSMAGFTSLDPFNTPDEQTPVIGLFKIPNHFFMTESACFHA